MTPTESTLLPNVRYNLYTDSGNTLETLVGFILNDVYYEGAENRPVGELRGDRFFYHRSMGGQPIPEEPIARLDGDTVVREDGVRFKLVIEA